MCDSQNTTVLSHQCAQKKKYSHCKSSYWAHIQYDTYSCECTTYMSTQPYILCVQCTHKTLCRQCAHLPLPRSSMWRSPNISAPAIPPCTNSRLPTTAQACPWRGQGGIPEVGGHTHLAASDWRDGNTHVSVRLLQSGTLACRDGITKAHPCSEKREHIRMTTRSTHCNIPQPYMQGTTCVILSPCGT